MLNTSVYCTLEGKVSKKQAHRDFKWIIMRLLLRRPRFFSAREMFVAAGVNTFKAVLRNLMHKCICELNASENKIMVGL